MLLAVVAGLAAGYGFIFQTADFFAKENVEDLHVTSNPFYYFMEDKKVMSNTTKDFAIFTRPPNLPLIQKLRHGRL